MNELILIGNLTRDPEKRYTQDGTAVCNFTLAVNRYAKADHPEADYFRVTVWREQAENCCKYLRKGKKAGVTGEVHLETYTDRDGAQRASLAVKAKTVEFLSPREATPAADGYVPVPDEDLPFDT